MIKMENHLGTIEISQEYFANLVGQMCIRDSSWSRQGQLAG